MKSIFLFIFHCSLHFAILFYFLKSLFDGSTKKTCDSATCWLSTHDLLTTTPALQLSELFQCQDLLNHEMLWSLLSICTTTQGTGKVTATCQGMERMCVQTSSDKTWVDSWLLLSSTRGRLRGKYFIAPVRAADTISEWRMAFKEFSSKGKKTILSPPFHSLVLSAPSVTKYLQELPFPFPPQHKQNLLPSTIVQIFLWHESSEMFCTTVGLQLQAKGQASFSSACSY